MAAPSVVRNGHVWDDAAHDLELPDLLLPPHEALHQRLGHLRRAVACRRRRALAAVAGGDARAAQGESDVTCAQKLQINETT